MLMKMAYLQSLPETTPNIIDKKYIGYRFLEGDAMVEQKHKKIIGDVVSVYRIIAVNRNSYEYKVEFERLEE